MLFEVSDSGKVAQLEQREVSLSFEIRRSWTEAFAKNAVLFTIRMRNGSDDSGQSTRCGARKVQNFMEWSASFPLRLHSLTHSLSLSLSAEASGGGALLARFSVFFLDTDAWYCTPNQECKMVVTSFFTVHSTTLTSSAELINSSLAAVEVLAKISKQIQSSEQ
jgi:hypothetical protein